jgi:imidazolonepropionase-like amidohydrolase
VTLIRGATVWTAAGQVLERTDVLLRDGRIAEVGRGLAAPAGARVVDGRGKHLTPGLIDPHSHLGVYPVPGVVGNRDGNEVAKPLSPQALALDGIWPQDPGISLALAAGVTTVHVIPGSANLVGGEGVVIKLIPGRSVAELQFPGAGRTLKMACGENPKRVYGKKGGPFTRMGNLARVRAAFYKAREYRRAWERYGAAIAQWKRRVERVCRGQGNAGWHGGRGEGLLPPPAPARDPALETLAGVLDGRVRVHCHCYRADEMQRMLELGRQFGFTIRAFHHATEAYKVRDLLRRDGTGVVTWVNWWGFKAEALDAIPEAAGLLAEAGVLTSLHSDSPRVLQRFNQEGALAYFRARDLGLKVSPDFAIRLVTLNPARLLGIDRQTGSIERGKMADLTLWDRSPLSVYARAEKVFVDGRLVHDRLARERRPSDFELSWVPRPGPLGPLPERQPTLPAGWSVPAPLLEKPPLAASKQVTAFVGAEVHTMAGPPLPRGTVIVRGGRVAAVGQDLPAPPGARVIDGKGMVLTPGLVAAESALGLVEISLEKATVDNIPSGKKLPVVRADLRTWEALNPASPTIPVTRLEGFTTAVVRAFGGLVSGQAAAFDLAGQRPGEMRLAAPVAVHANLGQAGAAATGGSRALALMQLRRALGDARRLKQARAAVERRRYRELAAPVPELAALIPVIERRVPLVVTVHRAADILAALRLAREQQIRLVLSGGAEGWRVADAIARARVPVLVEVDRNLPASFDALGGRFDNAARLYRAGVVVALSAAGEAHNARFLRQEAGIAVAFGLPHEAALAALTSVPAAVFGLPDRGRIVSGARANLVLWSGDPLELSSRPRQVFIGGEARPLTSRQTRLRDRYRRLDAWRK